MLAVPEEPIDVAWPSGAPHGFCSIIPARSYEALPTSQPRPRTKKMLVDDEAQVEPKAQGG